MNWKIKEIIYIYGCVLIFLPTVWCVQSSESGACQGLTTAAATYLQNVFGTSPSLKWNNYDGSDLKICTPPKTNGRSCCSQQHEKFFEDNVLKFITRFSQKTVGQELTTESTKLSEQVQSLLDKTREKLQYHLNVTYRVPDRHYYPALTSLFSNLSTFLKPPSSFQPQTTSPVPNLIENFFIKLFPPMFVFHIGGVSSDGNNKFIECLEKNYKSLSPAPFSNIPSEYGKRLGSVMLAYRALLGYLKISAQLSNRVMQAGTSDTCLKGLIKLRLCHLCRGQNVSLPCSDFCLNVHRGCFAHLLPLRSGWTELVKVMRRLVDVITTKQKLTDELRQFDRTVFKAVSHATHTVATYTTQVVNLCVKGSVFGNNQTSNATLKSTPQPAQNVNIFDNYLQPRLNVIRSILTNNQLFFDNLPNQYCKGLRSTNCWNGTYQSSIGYSRKLLEFTTSAQPVNPEVQMKAPESFSTTQVKNENMKLLQLAKDLTKLIDDELKPPTDVEGSGTGPGTGLPEDDEENPNIQKIQQDGISGSGEAPIVDPGNINPVTDVNPPKGKPNGNSVSRPSIPDLGFISTVAILFLAKHLFVT